MKIIIYLSALTAFLAFILFPQRKEIASIQTMHQVKAPSALNDAIIIKGEISQAILKSSNGCGIGNFLIPSVGDSSLGIPPTLGTLSNNWPEYFKILDTIPGTLIRGLAFKREAWQENTSVITTGIQTPYVIITNSGMYPYSISNDFSPYSGELIQLGALPIPNIIKVAKQITTDVNDPIVLIVMDSVNNFNLKFYSYPGLQEQFSIPFHFEPEIFEVAEDALFITGLDTSGNYMLYHFSSIQDTLYGTYTLNELAANAQEIITAGDSLFILSSPGDSITMLSTLNLIDSSLYQTTVYLESGARATYNEYENNKFFTFQPLSDTSNAILDKQILILNPVSNQLDTFMVNLELDYFKNPEPSFSGFGFYEFFWVGAKWQNGIADTVYINGYEKIKTEGFPQFINATYGCWASTNENELEKIKFECFPNPASTNITINLSGLKKGREYKLDISDSAGRSCFTTYLQAYQKTQLPLQNFPKGIYFINLDTGKNLITKKLIIQ
jgi:type IX secretion system substrate protein